MRGCQTFPDRNIALNIPVESSGIRPGCIRDCSFAIVNFTRSLIVVATTAVPNRALSLRIVSASSDANAALETCRSARISPCTAARLPPPAEESSASTAKAERSREQ